MLHTKLPMLSATLMLGQNPSLKQPILQTNVCLITLLENF